MTSSDEEKFSKKQKCHLEVLYKEVIKLQPQSVLLT